MAYDEFAVLTDRMFRIVMDPSKRITENRDSFLEGDAMILAIMEREGEAGLAVGRACVLAREILGRPFLAPPELPPERAAVLRSAFAATMRDPDFLKEAERANLEVELVTGAEVENVLATAAAAPAEVIERVRQALDRK